MCHLFDEVAGLLTDTPRGGVTVDIPDPELRCGVIGHQRGDPAGDLPLNTAGQPRVGAHRRRRKAHRRRMCKASRG